MALELFGGAAVGAVFGEFLGAVLEAKHNAKMFKSKLEELEVTLDVLYPVIQDINKLSRRLNGFAACEREIETIKKLMENGKNLVSKCSKVRRWSLHKKGRYHRKLAELDNKLWRFHNLHLPALMARDQKQTLLAVNNITFFLSAISLSNQNAILKVIMESTNVHDDSARIRIEFVSNYMNGIEMESVALDLTRQRLIMASENGMIVSTKLVNELHYFLCATAEIESTAPLVTKVHNFNISKEFRAIGAMLGEFQCAILEAKQNVEIFKPMLEELEDSLRIFYATMVLTEPLDESLEDDQIKIEMLKRLMKEGTNLVCKCSKVGQWSSPKMRLYRGKLVDLNEKILAQVSYSLQGVQIEDQMQTLLTGHIHVKLMLNFLASICFVTKFLSDDVKISEELDERNSFVLDSKGQRMIIKQDNEIGTAEVLFLGSLPTEDRNFNMNMVDNTNVRNHQNSRLRISEYEDDEMNDNGLCDEGDNSRHVEVLPLPPLPSDATDETTNGGHGNESEQMITQSDDDKPPLMQRLHNLEATTSKLKLFTPAIVLLSCFNLIMSFLIFMYLYK